MIASTSRCHQSQPAKCLRLALLCTVLAAAWAQAQPAAPASLPEPSLAPPLPGPVNPEPVVEVLQYQVRNVTLIEFGTVQNALKGMMGARTVEQLHRAALAVQALYVKAGYGAVVVYLPPQNVANGVVTLQAIEGHLSAVRVEGAPPGLSVADIKTRLPALKEGQTPRLDLLDLQLRMVNENPALRLRVVLLPGPLPQQTEAEISMAPGAQKQLSVSMDNTGTQATGRARLGLGWRDANFSGHDDQLDVNLQTAPKRARSFAAAGLNYRLPLYAAATTLQAYALVSDTKSERIAVGDSDLRFVGRGQLLGVRMTRFLARQETWDPRIALGLEHRQQRSQCKVDDLPEFVCGGGGESLRVTPLSVDYILANAARGQMALTVSLVQGLSWGDRQANRAAFEAVRPGAKPQFTLARVQAFASQGLGDSGWEASARLAAQVSGHALVPAMQFGAGGAASVRGYEERVIAADHGLALALELVAPRWTHGAGPVPALAWRPVVFVDAAGLRNRGDPPCSGIQSRCKLASTGLGVRLEAGAASAQLDVAHTLREAGAVERGRTWAHFSLRLVH